MNPGTVTYGIGISNENFCISFYLYKDTTYQTMEYAQILFYAINKEFSYCVTEWICDEEIMID